MNATPATDVCPVCLAAVETRGGDPLYCPGCCGKWFHQKCVDELIANGNSDCPNCRKTLPVSNVAATLPRPVHRAHRAPPPPPMAGAPQAAPAAPAAAPAQNNRNNSFLGSLFRFGSTSSNNNIQQQQQIPQQQQSVSSFSTSGTSSVRSALMREEPVEILPAAEGSEAGSSLPTVSIVSSPEFQEAGLARQNSFYAQISLRYEESAQALAESSKTALDLVCVLDNSGSMTGRKIESLKRAMEFVLDRLGPRDRLSVVHFNSTAGGLHGLLRMTAENKETSKRLLRDLRATGGTSILAGMQYGWDVMERRISRNPTTCVFLLTDGQDRSNMQQKLDLARHIKSCGSSMFVFGFGSDHDAEHMSAIADAAEASFTYIESDDMVVDAFGGSIGTQQGQALSNITLDIQACERDVRILQTQAGRYTITVQPDGRSSSVQFLNMYMGETREVLVQLDVPAVDAAVEDYALVTASASYFLQQSADASGGASGTSSTALTSSGSVCVVQRLPDAQLTAAATTRNLQIDISLNRVLCTTNVTEAVREADAGNFGVARQIIADTKARLQSSISYQTLVAQLQDSSTAATATAGAGSVLLALMQELDDALLRVRSRSEYDRGGKAMMLETVNANAYQRSTYTKGGRARKYQTNVSSTVQDCAMNSKSSYSGK